MVRKLTFATLRSKDALSARAEFMKKRKEKSADLKDFAKKYQDALEREKEKKKSVNLNLKSLTVVGEAENGFWQRARYTAIPGSWKRGSSRSGYVLFVQTDTFDTDNTPSTPLKDVKWDPFVSPVGIALNYTTLTEFLEDSSFLADCYPTLSAGAVATGAKTGPPNCSSFDSGSFRLAQGGFGAFLNTDGLGPDGSDASLFLVDSDPSSDVGTYFLFSEIATIMAGLGLDHLKYGVFMDPGDLAGFSVIDITPNKPSLAYYGTPEDFIKDKKVYLVDNNAQASNAAVAGVQVNSFTYETDEENNHVVRNVMIAFSILLVGLLFAYLLSLTMKE